VVGDQFDITNKLLRDQEATSSRSMHHSDGARVQVDIAASQISMDGHVRTLLVCRDVTERLMSEHELMDVASREQAHLAQDLHDGLGQQLTGIALFLRGLGTQIVRELPAHAEDFERVNALVSKSSKIRAG
jgi:signal transduction histidine kinase